VKFKVGLVGKRLEAVKGEAFQVHKLGRKRGWLETKEEIRMTNHRENE
jgi:hypothetical protein